ncbi:MAG: hypothetical protein AAB071_03730 [Bacteroidota bacterium]
MAKQQTFADKATKLAAQAGRKCPKCGEISQPTLFISTERSQHGGWRFSEKHIKVCKCNEKEAYA